MDADSSKTDSTAAMFSDLRIARIRQLIKDGNGGQNSILILNILDLVEEQATDIRAAIQAADVLHAKNIEQSDEIKRLRAIERRAIEREASPHAQAASVARYILQGYER